MSNTNVKHEQNQFSLDNNTSAKSSKKSVKLMMLTDAQMQIFAGGHRGSGRIS